VTKPDTTAVRARVASIVSSVTHTRVDAQAHASRETIEEWDSLSHVEILFAIEEDQGVEFGEDVMDHLDSVDAITAEIVRLHGVAS
jgi:acyl carrier protein